MEHIIIIEGTYSYIDNKRVYEETKAQANTILNFITFLSSILIFTFAGLES